MASSRLKSGVAYRLLHLGEEITAIRTTLGIQDGFEPYATYLRYRQSKSSIGIREPKVAAQFLPI
jgi:hypothetical protein